ncbi:MAG TPA: undecaprenyl/decaprenyl-phosphate alpha-N-acetylglucosaminyl 1-phosphate transferase [Acidimicrobiales bacterium]|nr:undecaprenyl/decaprenyl-phosphate alpha-N-acetylglucosaminyl 1-phosphate transferase [Acidimicrobiales bacterium]
MTHFREYLVIFGVAAVTTFLMTFVVRVVARRHSLLVLPDARRVHERPTPIGGGAAMYLGMLVAVAVASQLPAFAAIFRGNSAPLGIVLGATAIFVVGIVDDLREMSPPAKMAGQVLAGTILYFLNVNMLYFHVPLAGTLVLSANWAVLGTVLWVVVMANAVNFIDGLDGLAAGIVAIAAAAFFFYAHTLGDVGNITSNNVGPLIAVITVGLCVGFLPHNFYPARIFMGDAGAMLLGVLVAASTLAVVGQNSYQFSGRTYFFFAPIIIPFFILGIPILDTSFAVVRRAGKRLNPAVADLNHLHHRLMRLGHGHRQAVVILWAWTALLSGAVLWPGVTNSHNEIPPIAVGGLAILLYTLFAPRGGSASRFDPLLGAATDMAPEEPNTNGAKAGTKLAPLNPTGGGRPSVTPPAHTPGAHGVRVVRSEDVPSEAERLSAVSGGSPVGAAGNARLPSVAAPGRGGGSGAAPLRALRGGAGAVHPSPPVVRPSGPGGRGAPNPPTHRPPSSRT